MSEMDEQKEEGECAARWEGGPHRWEPGAPGCPEWCYYCEREREVTELQLDKITIGTRQGEPMAAESVAKDLETMARKLREIGAPVEFELSVYVRRIAQ